MEARLEIGDERKMGPEEYVEEERWYRCGEEVREGSCRMALLLCGKCWFQAGHNWRTCHT